MSSGNRDDHLLALPGQGRGPLVQRTGQVAAMLECQADGLLLAMARRDDPMGDELRASGMPLVLVNRTIDRGGVLAVVPDDFYGAVEAVEHLYALGHRRLAFVGGPLSTSNGARRRSRFDETVQRLGLPEIAALETSAFDEAAGHAAAQTPLTEHPRITDVVAGNDLIAVGIIVAASERGRNCLIALVAEPSWKPRGGAVLR